MDVRDPASLLKAAAAARSLRRSRSLIVAGALVATGGGVVVLPSVMTGSEVTSGRVLVADEMGGASFSNTGAAWMDSAAGVAVESLEWGDVLVSVFDVSREVVLE